MAHRIDDRGSRPALNMPADLTVGLPQNQVGGAKVQPTTVPEGAALFAGAEGRRARGVAGPKRLAQLQLHGAELVRPTAAPAAPEALPPVAAPLDAPSPLQAAFDNLTPPTVRGDVRLLEGNTESWLCMWNALSRAKGPLDASYFIFQRDIFGMAYLGQLLRKAREGQPVRLMLDAAGDAFGKKGFTLTGRGQDYLQELVNTGSAKVKVYHPLHKKLISNLKSGGLPFSGVANNHDKLTRTEDTVVTGGRNISKDYFTAPEDRADVYRDTDVLVRGRAASKAFADAFDTEWDQEDLHFSVYPDVAGNFVRRDLELLASAEMMDLWLNRPVPSAEEKARLRTDKGYRKQTAEALLDEALQNLPKDGISRTANFWDRRNLRRLARELVNYAELAGSATTFEPDAGLHKDQELKVIDRTSAAVKSEDELTAALATLAAGAQKRIIIQNPYVVLTTNALAALEAAGERGVQIDLLTNSPDSSDSVLTQAFFLEDWPKILARVPNMRIFVMTGEQKLHAKSATADDLVSVVGSYNLDLLSEKVNGEIAVTSDSPELARDVRKTFESDLANPVYGVVEYTIERDGKGKPVLRDGEPVVTYGPNDHMTGWSRAQYAVLRFMVRQARKLPALSAISGIELN